MPLLARAQHRDSARLADRERRPRVLTEVERLERHRLRRVLEQQRRQRLVQLAQPPLGARGRRRLDDPAVERDQPPAAARDDAIARVREARVDSQHDHLFG